MKGITLIGKKKISKGKTTSFHKPKYIYIPLIRGNDTDITVLVKKNDYVCKGEVVARSKGNLSIPFLSSVSGTVLDFEEKLYHNGQYVRCIKIENDWKERVLEKDKPRKDITSFTKEEFISKIKDAGIIGMGGAGFPTYVKYQTQKRIKTLIINAVECEPYITSDATLIMDHAEEILETIDAIMEIYKIETCLIGVKKNNLEVIRAFQKFLGTYVHIHLALVPNRYPMGWEKLLIETVTKKTYQYLPIEAGIIVNNVSTIYAIYQALKYDTPLVERMVTFTGEMLKNPINVSLKIGTPVGDVLKAIGGLKRALDIVCIAGGPMMGIAIPSDDMIITPDVNCILIMKDRETPDENPCFRCGKCVKVCPAGIAPVLIKDAHLQQDALKPLHPEKCIRCGLCSYICPAKINVRSYVRKANETMRKE